MRVTLFRTIFIATYAVLSSAASLSQEDIPAKDFVESWTFREFRVSPNGKYVSAITKWKEKDNLYVIDLETRETKRITTLKRYPVGRHFWANNERIAFTLQHEGKGSGGIGAVNFDGRQFRILRKPVNATANQFYRGESFVDRFERMPNEILVSRYVSKDEGFDLYRMNIYSGKLQKYASHPGRVSRWVTDWDGNALLAITSNDELTDHYFYRRTPKDDWNQIATFKHDERNWSPVISRWNNSPFSRDGNTLFVSNNIGHDKYVIQEFELRTLELGPIIHKDDTYDAYDIYHSNHTEKLAGVLVERDKESIIWFDDEKRTIQRYLDAKFPEMVSTIENTSLDESRFIVKSISERIVATYSLITIENGKLNHEILSNDQKIKPERLSETLPFAFKARDGMEIHGYLTLPQGKVPKNLPMIVHPHGGPWARDSWGYNYQVQFLANRGFAVLQLNFRCSEGYGWSFLNAGNKKWGTTMQYDIVDGINWAIDQGYVDRNRIGIYGTSYGGYATLAQLAFYPELYQFGISNVAPVDLISLMEWRKQIDQDSVYNYYKTRIGDPETDKELLNDHSPINFVENIKAPLMVIHGTKDSRVPIEQAKMLRSALEKHNKDYKWLVKAREGHGFADTPNRVEQLNQMDEFLAPFRDR